MDYDASGGREIFLSFEDDHETLFGLLRMRIQSKPVAALAPEIKGNLALIRELHVFGPEVPLSEQKAEAAQHKGLGKALLTEAERIASAEFRAQRMVVLSGVGAKEYYHTEFGYHSDGNYMVKNL
jgi:elongator complex protein 3